MLNSTTNIKTLDIKIQHFDKKNTIGKVLYFNLTCEYESVTTNKVKIRNLKSWFMKPQHMGCNKC